MKTRIALVGPMGCGKSTIGNALARSTGLRYLDIDALVVEREKRAISDIFSTEGEPFFRQLESKALSDACHHDNVIIATGGGAVLDKTNRELLHNSCKVYYLHAPISTLIQRTRGDSNRPLLEVADPFATLSELVRQREPYYESVAHHAIDTDGKNVEAIVSEIENTLK